MQCPSCGGALTAGGSCPACGWVGEQLGQQVSGRVDEPSSVEFPDVCETPAPPAPEVPVPYPNIDKASDHTDKPVKVNGDMVNVPGTTYTPSEGDEPGTGGSGLSPLPGGNKPLLVAGIVIALVIILGVTVYLLSGDGNGDGNGGPGPDGGLLIDPVETTVETVWEPRPGFHLSILVRNDANASQSLGGLDLLVTVHLDTEEVGRATMALSGDLPAGLGRGVLIDVPIDLTSGRTYEVEVLLREDAGSKTVDEYSTEVTVPMT